MSSHLLGSDYTIVHVYGSSLPCRAQALKGISHPSVSHGLREEQMEEACDLQEYKLYFKVNSVEKTNLK